MTTTYERHGTDRDLEKGGFWFPITPTEKYLLARAGGANVRFAKAVETTTRPHSLKSRTRLSNSILPTR